MKNENQIRGIERQIVKINMELANLKTNHVLHLLLCVFTIGLWVFVWGVCVLSNENERGKLKTRQTKLERQLDLLWEGV